MGFHELKNVLTVNNVPLHGGSLPLDPFLQSSVEFELIRTFRKDFSEIFDTNNRERERDLDCAGIRLNIKFPGNLSLSPPALSNAQIYSN